VNSKHPINKDSLNRFVKLLDINLQSKGVKELKNIVGTFMRRVPFENISKLYYKKHHHLQYLPDFDMYLDGIEKYNFGGTCYSNNYYLNLLLHHLGYDAKLCGADMSTPDAHLVNVVSIEKTRFLVDAGYAAPFLVPLPLDLDTDHTVVLGRDRYVLKPRDKNGNSKMMLYREGKHIHGYLVKPIAREIDYFNNAIEDSFRDNSTFMNSLLAVRFYSNSSIVINNMTLIESEGTESRKSILEDRNEITHAVEKHFSIPGNIVKTAISEITEFGNAWN
jgi:N-hydroxyarylamine O-acetyltransferase